MDSVFQPARRNQEWTARDLAVLLTRLANLSMLVLKMKEFSSLARAVSSPQAQRLYTHSKY